MSDLVLSDNWYQSLVEDLKAEIVEREFTSRWELVELYHSVGSRLLNETANFNNNNIYGAEITKRVALSLNKSQRTIQLAVQFATKYPSLDMLPDGKATSWTKVTKLLPNNSEELILPDLLPLNELRNVVEENAHFLAENAKVTKKGVVFTLDLEKYNKYLG